MCDVDVDVSVEWNGSSVCLFSFSSSIDTTESECNFDVNVIVLRLISEMSYNYCLNVSMQVDDYILEYLFIRFIRYVYVVFTAIFANSRFVYKLLTLMIWLIHPMNDDTFT